MTLPDPQAECHNHLGVEFPNKPVGFYVREPGEDPQGVEVGHLCPVCGLTESPAAITRRLEAATDWAAAGQDVDVEDDEDEWLIPSPWIR